MKECWAASLNDCSDKITKEHTISKCILPSKLAISGFSWCLDPKEIFKEDFKSYCLCDTHNKRTSELDIAAKDFLLVLKKIDRTLKIRTKLNNPTYVSIKVNGVKFERWCFKTLCNVLHVSRKWKPPDDLVKIIFGLTPFPDRCGLCFVYNIGESVKTDDKFYISEMRHPKLGVVGIFLMYYGWRLCGSWVHSIDTLPGIFSTDGISRHAFYHMNNFDFTHAKLIFRIDWTNKFNNDTSALIKLLRKNNQD